MSNWKKKLRRPAGKPAKGPMDMTMFVDETGWTGSNIADKDQRTVFYGGLLVPTEGRHEFETAIRTVLATHPKKLAAEPKGTDLVQKHPDAVERVLRYCQEFGSVFVVAGTEKLYQVGCMIPHFIHDGGWHERINGTVVDSSLAIPRPEVVARRPANWIHPEELAVAYYSHLQRHPDALKAFYKAFWPGPDSEDQRELAVDQALKQVEAILNKGTSGGLTIRELLNHPGVTSQQTEAAVRELEAIFGHAPSVSDLFALYDRSADLFPSVTSYEPGMVTFGNLINNVCAWLDDLSEIFATAERTPVNLRDIISIDIVQDEPAVSGSADYKAAYSKQLDLSKAVNNAPWIRSHTFATSHDSPGIIAADIWVAFARTLWKAVQSGRTAPWEPHAQSVFRRGWSWAGFMAPPAMRREWVQYMTEKWSSNPAARS